MKQVQKLNEKMGKKELENFKILFISLEMLKYVLDLIHNLTFNKIPSFDLPSIHFLYRAGKAESTLPWKGYSSQC